ncbi:MAG: PH domain-containing protein [Actinomycetota bacterium]
MDQRTYRNASYPLLGWLLIGVLVAGGLYGAFASTRVGALTRVLTAAIPIIATVLPYRAYVRARLTARDDGLTVLNPFHDIHVPWADVEGFDTKTQILRIRLTSGSVIRVWAVQPAGLRHVVTRGARADEILTDLHAMLESARGGTV